MDNPNKNFIREFHAKRCGDIQIENEQQYETLLYKTLVVNLTIFDGDNWGNFEFTTWVAAINRYEFENNLPCKYSILREQLERNHQGFNIESEENIDVLEGEYNKSTAQKLDPQYALIFNAHAYLYHLHKSVEVMFHGTKEDKQQYDYAKYWQAVKYYEYQRLLTSRSAQFFMDERFREIHSFRSKLLGQIAS